MITLSLHKIVGWVARKIHGESPATDLIFHKKDCVAGAYLGML